MNEMKLKRVWQCGHCGVVYDFEDWNAATNCCCESEELSFRDVKTSLIYSPSAIKQYLCNICNGYGNVSGGINIEGASTSVRCHKCNGTGLKERPLSTFGKKPKGT